MPKNAIEMEGAGTDVTRQAELVVMDCLKSWSCPKALTAFMEKSSASRVSAIASERFSNDMKLKKKATDERVSLLEYMLSTTGEHKDTPTSSSRRRPSSATKDVETDAGSEWTKEETSALKKAIKKTSAVEDKTARWKQIAGLVGKTKKHCYVKYKELKEEQTKSPRRKRPTEDKNKSDVTEPVFKSDTKLAKDDNSNATDNGKSDADESSSKPDSLKASQEIPATAFVVSHRAAAPEIKSVNTSLEVLEVEDCEDMGMLLDQPTSSRPQSSRSSSNIGSGVVTRILTATDVAAVQQLLFGANKKAFSSHWEEQGFVFSTVRDLQYGLVQHQGGPCGILAVVQGYVLRFLLQHAPVDWKNAGLSYQERALVQALAHILWQAVQTSRGSECVVAVRDGSTGQRRFMAGLKLHVATSEIQAQQILTTHLVQFTDPTGSGLVQFVLSVLLTKGVDPIKNEMDELAGGQLIGAHDYCTQEIVNLLLCGYARSNVFDGDQVLEGASDADTLVLRGISSQSEIGFLSLFEAYQNLVVGSHLKQPRVNIWVVCSESHYSVLFAADPRSLEDRAWETRPRVDLLYYDGLANQDEEIRLTVDALAITSESNAMASHEDLIPPLNLVLRTKWPRATVDWNGVDPLL